MPLQQMHVCHMSLCCLHVCIQVVLDPADEAKGKGGSRAGVGRHAGQCTKAKASIDFLYTSYQGPYPVQAMEGMSLQLLS